VSAEISNTVLTQRQSEPSCEWEEYAHRQLVFWYKSVTGSSKGDCWAHCCSDARCKAVSTETTGSQVQCLLHASWELGLMVKSEGSSVAGKVDRIGCKRACYTDEHCGFRGCGKCNIIFNQCQAGYKCGCVCSVDNDCDHSRLESGCSKCTSIDPHTQFGRCRPATCAQPCVSDTDCSDAPGCGVCSAGQCSPRSPDPIPDNCVAPFPGHPHSNCSASMDLILLLDGSASIDAVSWLKILQFTANIGLNFTTGHDFMRYAVVQFSSVSTVYMPLSADNATFQQTMMIMQQQDSSTNTSGGVQVAEREFNTNGRPNAFKVLVILTDGQWNTGGSPLEVTDRMKANGVHIFTVAVGDASIQNVGQDQLTSRLQCALV
jgi:hypothetical protein